MSAEHADLSLVGTHPGPGQQPASRPRTDTGPAAGRHSGLWTALAIGRGIRRRAVQLVISLIGLSLVLFVLLHLSGNPAYTIAGATASPETIHAIEVELGLDKPLYLQYLTFLEHMVTLRFGVSSASGTPAAALVWSRLPFTLLLALYAMLVALLVGVPLGIWLAMRHRTFAARGVHTTVKAAQSVPGFVFGLVLVLIFAEHLRWFPVVGADESTSAILPTLALASYLTPSLVRLTRSAASDVLRAEHVTVARAKGLSDPYIGWQYVTRNSLVTITALLSLQLARLVSGAVIIEALFAWPGIGSLMVTSVLSGDFAVVEAAVVSIAVIISVVNAVVDSILPLLDPRVRTVT